jgi:hypothetical protein
VRLFPDADKRVASARPREAPKLTSGEKAALKKVIGDDMRDFLWNDIDGLLIIS